MQPLFLCFPALPILITLLERKKTALAQPEPKDTLPTFNKYIKPDLLNLHFKYFNFELHFPDTVYSAFCFHNQHRGCTTPEQECTDQQTG